MKLKKKNKSFVICNHHVIPFVCNYFNDAVSNTNCIVLNDWMMSNELERLWKEARLVLFKVYRGADKSLAFPISYFPICSTTKRIFLGWVKEVRTMKS
jgi:hypothetical protein